MVGYQKHKQELYPGMKKRKGVRFPCCRATVMETKTCFATVPCIGMGRRASRMS